MYCFFPGPGTVQTTTVVPHDQVLGSPDVPVNKFWSGGNREEFFQKLTPFFDWPAYHVRCMGTDEDGLLAGFGYRAHEGLFYRRIIVFHCLGNKVGRNLITRMAKAVFDNEILNDVPSLLR